jgi:hypothetical protein
MFMVCCGRSAVEVSGDVNGTPPTVTFEANDGVECPVADGDAGRMVECLPQPVSLVNPMFVGLPLLLVTHKQAHVSSYAELCSEQPRARREGHKTPCPPTGSGAMVEARRRFPDANLSPRRRTMTRRGLGGTR